MSCITPESVHQAFLAAPPLLSEQIYDLTVKHPNWARDIAEVVMWPQGAGNVIEQLVFRGQMPQIERGLDAWARRENMTGCTPCAPDGCSYHWTTMGGHSFERKLATLMSRDFRSPSYCIKEIQTTAQFEQVFAKIVENLYAQTDFFKEMNLGLNILTMLAKKYIVDSDGPKPNTNNVYVYRNVGSARLSTLNIIMLEFFYEHMRRLPDVYPYDVVDGAPLFALEASPQLLARLWRDDPQLRQDARFSGLATDLLLKYNFMSTIRGMFIPAPILYPRRFNLLPGTGEPVEVLPFINDVPGEVGVHTYLNPAYEMATHEEVLLHGRYPYKIFVKDTLGTLGEGTSFGPEASFMNTWQWVNPQTDCDPARREGFFMTNAEIAIAEQFSQGIFGILVERPKTATTAMYTPDPVCPPVAEDCDNSVPPVTCPCPVLATMPLKDPFNDNTYFFTFLTAVTGVVDDDLILELDSGATVTGNIEQISDDGKSVSVSFLGDLDMGICTHIIGVSCESTTGCWATVESASDCRSGETGSVRLILSNAIKADTAGDIVVAYFGDCTTAELAVVSVNPESLEWIMEYGAGFGPTDDPTGAGGSVLTSDIICDRGGISKVCVPTATDASCSGCEATITECSDET